MESVQVTTENLTKKSNEINGMATEYYNLYEALFNDVSQLTSTDWKGDEANAFKEQIEGFRQDFTNMKQKMEEYANFLRTAATNYEETQANSIGTIKSLQN